jgi:hypothetical protein
MVALFDELPARKVMITCDNCGERFDPQVGPYDIILDYHTDAKDPNGYWVCDCSQSITHAELADNLGVDVEVVEASMGDMAIYPGRKPA